LMIHQFFMSDAQDVHDHPWTSFGRILKTGYLEVIGDNDHAIQRNAGDWSWRGAKSLHRVYLKPGTEGKVWTLFGTLKRVRKWGFIVNKQWIPFDEYFKSNGTFEVQSAPENYRGVILPKKVIG